MHRSNRQKLSTPARDALLVIVFGALALLLGTLLSDTELAIRAYAVIALTTGLGAAVGALVATNGVVRLVAPDVPLSTRSIDPARLVEIERAHLVTQDQLRQIEASVDVSEIWVVTREPAIEVGGEGFMRVIETNIRERKISYVYVVPDRIGTAAENALRAPLPDHGLSIVRLSGALWVRLPMSTHMIVVYNPRAERSFHPCAAYFEYPTDDERYWGKVEPRMALEWADAISIIIEEASASGSTPAPPGRIVGRRK